MFGRIDIGIFDKDCEEASAYGSFVHVFVDPNTQKKAPIPQSIRQALEKLQKTENE